MRKTISGFTIVELLIVIVVIAILAAISVVSYNGITQRARDAERQTEMGAIEKALEMYHADFGGYPNCAGGTYIPGQALGSCTQAGLAAALVPNYLSAMPTDPKNSGNDVYRYAYGYRKTSPTTFTGDQSDNYITGMRMETVTGNLNNGWASPAYYNYLGGSAN